MKKKKPIKALFFSVSIGAGHDSAARALIEELLEQAPGSEVKMVDTFQYINSVLNKVVVGSYMETLKFTPKVWGYLYDQAEDGEKLVDLGQILSKVLSPKIEQLLNDFNPDIIFATHAFPTGMLAVLKSRGQIKVPLVSVVTDFHVHLFYIHQGVDFYFIAARDISHSLRQNGIPIERIKPTGIPIRRQFREMLDVPTTKDRLELGVEPTVLVMGGGLGMGRIELISREILADDTFQVVVVAGKNIRLMDNLKRINNPRLKVFGFVENMCEIMTAADIIISKPGGVTTSEILALGKPLVIYSSLPGQEDRNTEFLLNRGAAIRVKKIEMLVPEMKSFWTDSVRKKCMSEMSKHLGSPEAGALIWENLWSLLSDKQDYEG